MLETEEDKRKIDYDAYLNLCRSIYDMVWKWSIASLLIDTELNETDYSTLTAQEIMDKINAFLKQKPSDVNAIIFLNYLATYPVSMCKREVSPFLKSLIGFHYRLGVPTKEQQENGAEKISYDDLAQIFERSKATISECINRTEQQWKAFQQDVEKQKEIELEAKKQLIEEAKRRMKEENQTNERTADLLTERDICS